MHRTSLGLLRPYHSVSCALELMYWGHVQCVRTPHLDVPVAVLECSLLATEDWLHWSLVWPYTWTSGQVLCSDTSVKVF